MGKRLIAALLLLVLCTGILTPVAEAASFELPIYKDGVFYGSRTGKVLELEDRGRMANTYVIQSSVNGKKVTELEEDVMWGLSGMNTVVLPDTVTKIPASLGLDESSRKNVTFVCKAGTEAAKYAANNGIQQLTPEEVQRRIDAQTVNNKTVTVMVDKSTVMNEASYKAADKSDVTLTVTEHDASIAEMPLDKTGSVTVEASDAAVLEITSGDYHGVKVDFKTLDKENPNVFYLDREKDGIFIRSVSVEYDDEGTVKTQDVYHGSYVIDRYGDEPTTMYADIDWNGHGAGSVYLEQTGAEADFSGGKLTMVLMQKFDTTEAIYVVAKAADGKTVKRKLDIKGADVLLEGSELDLTSGLGVKLPSKIPFVGGSELNFSLFKFPVDICIENGRVYGVVGFNLASYSYEDKDLSNGKPGRDAKVKKFYFDLKNGLKDADKSANDLKKLFKDKRFSKYRLRTHNEMAVTGDVEVMGYFEGTLRPDGGLRWSDVQIIIQAGGKIEFGGQFQAGPVPMYWKMYFKGDFEGRLSLYKIVVQIANDSKGSPFLPYGSLSFAVTVGGGLGLGASGLFSAGGGVEGSIGPTFTFKDTYIHRKLVGTLSVYAEASAAFFEWKKTWQVSQGTWWEGKWNYPWAKSRQVELMQETADYDSVDLMAEMNNPASYHVQDQGYLGHMGPFLGNRIDLMGSEISLTPFQQNVYEMPEPQLVKLENGTQVMVWIGGVPGRVSPNRTAIYWSSCPKGGTWSRPAPVADDGTADFSPKLTADGNTAWLVWQNAKKTFDAENVTPEVAAAAMEICAARFSGTKFEKAASLTDNAVYDYLPEIAVGAAGTRVYWVQSSQNVLTGYADDCRMLCADYNGTSWSAPAVAYTVNAPVLDLAADGSGAQFQTAYVVDTDGSGLTVDGTELYRNGAAETANDVADLAPCFVDGVLYWNQNGTLRREDGTAVLGDRKLETAAYDLYADESGRLAVVYAVDQGVYSELFGVFVDEALGTVSEPVRLTERGDHTQSGGGRYSAAEGLVLPCAVTAVVGDGVIEGTEDGTENGYIPLGQTDLMLLSYAEESKLVLEDVRFDEMRQVAGNNFTVYATIRNDGNLPADGFDVVLWDDESKMPVTEFGDSNPKASDVRVTEPLAGGESREVELTFLLPEDFSGKYTVTVTPVTGAGYDDDEVREGAVDAREITLSDRYNDLSVSANAMEAADGGALIQGVIHNVGDMARTNLPVTLSYLDAEDQEVVVETKTVSIGANEQGLVCFEQDIPLGEVYRITVEAQDDETAEGNNTDFCTFSQEMLIGKARAKDGTMQVPVRVTPMEDSEKILYTAAYDEAGRMLAVKAAAVSGQDPVVHTAELPESAAEIRCFLLNRDDYKPVCRESLYLER